MARTLFTGLAWLLAAGIATQVFLAGLAIFVDPGWWGVHRSFVHAIEVVVLLLFALSFLARLPASLRWLSAAAFGLIAVQYATIELGLSALAAMHPVNAMLLFWLAVTLARRARVAGDGGRPALRSAASRP